MKIRTAIVTGASAGIGACVAGRLYDDGWNVVAIARRKEKLRHADDPDDQRFHCVGLDVTDTVAVKREMAAILERFPDIEVLVNNAGLALGMVSAGEANLDDWDRMIETNCRSLVHLTRHVLPRLISRRHGSIVNVGSLAGVVAYPCGNVYGASKAFVRQFTQNLNADLVGTGVRATCVEPGLCGGTEFSLVRFDGDREKAEGVYKGTQPLTAEDIADVIAWVISRPAHVNINEISLMPTCQGFSAMNVVRTG